VNPVDGLDNVGDELRDILDKYVATPKNRQDQLHQLATEASSTVDRFFTVCEQRSSTERGRQRTGNGAGGSEGQRALGKGIA